jgi:hypothetical protein
MFDFPGMPIPLSLRDNPTEFEAAARQVATVLAGLENRPHQFTIDIRPLDEAPRVLSAIPMDDDEVAMLGAAHRLHVNMYDMFGKHVLAVIDSEIQPPEVDEIVWNEPEALVVLAYSFIEATAGARSSWIEHCCDLMGFDADRVMAAFETINFPDDRIHQFLQAVVAWEVLDSQKNVDIDVVPDGFTELFEHVANVGKDLLTEFVNECLARADEVSALNNLWEKS